MSWSKNDEWSLFDEIKGIEIDWKAFSFLTNRTGMDLYILDADDNPRRCTDLREWNSWMGDNPNRRIVAQRQLKTADITVSTVFLDIDHNFMNRSRTGPILFETMIFGGRHDGETWRCSTIDRAREYHAAALDMVLGTPEEPKQPKCPEPEDEEDPLLASIRKANK